MLWTLDLEMFWYDAEIFEMIIQTKCYVCIVNGAHDQAPQL